MYLFLRTKGKQTIRDRSWLVKTSLAVVVSAVVIQLLVLKEPFPVVICFFKETPRGFPKPVKI